ncbi:hypothetical protein ACUVZD_000235 [Pseudomonas aeruginosa]
MRKLLSEQPLSLAEEDLLKILVGLVRSPAAMGEEWDRQRHRSFLARLAQVVADECGGEVEPSNDGQLLIRLNESSPEGGGIWAQAESKPEPSALDALRDEVWVDEQLSSHFHALQVPAPGTVVDIS